MISKHTVDLLSHLYDTKEVLEENVAQLISALYKPTLDKNLVADYKRLEEYEIDAYEPVDWANLDMEVSEEEINLVGAKDCPTLINYLKKYLAAYGWNPNVTSR